MIIRPKLASCSDRKKLPRSNSYCGDPESWFRSSVLEKFKLRALTFDFFVNWNNSPLDLTTEFWLKGLAQCKLDQLKDITIIIQHLNEAYGENYIESYIQFCAANHASPVAIIFNDKSDWENTNPELLFVTFRNSLEGDNEGEIDRITKSELMDRIQKNSGGPIKIGSKGLYYGTSRLECYLSKTTSLYPGDADLLLIDENGIAQCVLEFKKHNLATSIRQQKLSNYYPFPDGRKYDRLEILRKHLSTINKEIPVVVIYYPTNSNIKEGVIELINGNIGKLKTMATKSFTLPDKENEIELHKTVQLLLKGVAYFKENK